MPTHTPTCSFGFGIVCAITDTHIFVYRKGYNMTTANTKFAQIVIFTVYNADGEGSSDDFHQYVFHNEKDALCECASFMTDMVKESDMFLSVDPSTNPEWLNTFSQALQREDIREAMDIFNDGDNQEMIRVQVETLLVKL